MTWQTFHLFLDEKPFHKAEVVCNSTFFFFNCVFNNLMTSPRAFIAV